MDYVKNSNSDKDYIHYAATLGLKFNYIDTRRMCFFGFFEKRRVASMGVHRLWSWNRLQYLLEKVRNRRIVFGMPKKNINNL